MPTPEHNPQSIPPSQIPPGWRLCRESEREKLPMDARVYNRTKNCFKNSASRGKAPLLYNWNNASYITATPLPESEREVTAASPWIPLSEREPTESDWDGHDVFLGKLTGGCKIETWRFQFEENIPRYGYTHWIKVRHVELPPLPPAPAKTQREKDEAFIRTIISSSCSGRERSLCLFTAETALAHERAHFGGRSAEEVAARINEISLYNNVGTGAGNALRALLSPPKKGETKHE